MLDCVQIFYFLYTIDWSDLITHTHTQNKKNSLVLFLQRQIFMIVIAITSVWYESSDFGSYMFTDL